MNVTELPEDAIPEPPERLGKSGVTLWYSIVTDWELPASDLETLAAACRLRDTVDDLRQAFGNDPRYLVKGSMGQDVLNGLVVEIRQTETTVSTLLGKLRLTLPDDEDEQDYPLNRKMTRSESGRFAANSRWGNRRGQNGR